MELEIIEVVEDHLQERQLQELRQELLQKGFGEKLGKNLRFRMLLTRYLGCDTTNGMII